MSSSSSSILIAHIKTTPIYHAPKVSSKALTPRSRTVNRPFTLCLNSGSSQRSVPISSRSPSNGEEEEEGLVQDLRVPQQWLDPTTAAKESEWLRTTLHKWLDDEYCPEPTNIDISKTAARSYYKSLMEKETDLGEILLKMARELESISYQESFHGAFSSANAAINLIIQKIDQVN